MISPTQKNYKKFKAKKTRIGGKGKRKKEWRTIDFSEQFASQTSFL